MILNGSMYMLRTTDREGKPVRHDDGQLQATLKEIYALVSEPAWPTLPDLEVLINADDYGRVSATEVPLLPLLSITKKRGKGADLLYPAGHYAVAGRSVTAIGTAEGAAEYRRPWASKNSSVAFWRGRPNSHTLSRWALPRLAIEGSAEERQLLDLGLMWYMHAHDPFVRANQSSAPIPLRPGIDMFEHAQYKYLVHLDGHSYSHRLVKLLATNSVVLKEETADLEYYYHLLEPYVHYLPFHFRVATPNYRLDVPPRRRQPRLDSIVTNLTQVVHAARLDDDGARRIAEQAHALAHTHLCDAARRCYLYELLRRYGKAMKYQPSLADRPGARLVTRSQEVVFFPPEETGSAAAGRKGQRRSGRGKPRGLTRRTRLDSINIST